MIFFKLPFDNKIWTTNETSDESFIQFFGFDNSETIRFNGKINEIPLEDLQKTEFELPEDSNCFEGENEQEYEEKLKKVIEFIQENQLPKLVISRRKVLKFHKIDLGKSFLNLTQNYPNAFAYVLVKDEICWMGAFSEVLGKFNKKNNQFETMSLAGTLPLDEEWELKEIEEQKTVTQFIKNTLLKFSSEKNIKISETYSHISGNIKHLRTDFQAEILSENLDKIISELHPTPAVCGIPKEFCKKAIEDFEKFPREFYAGYSKIETEDFIYFFVNLRCAKIYKNSAHLIVGGGITAQSNPQKEWRETELKSEAVMKNLVIS